MSKFSKFAVAAAVVVVVGSAIYVTQERKRTDEQRAGIEARERIHADQVGKLKSQQSEVEKNEKVQDNKSKVLDKKVSDLAKRESGLKGNEDDLAKRAKELDDRTVAVATRERALKDRDDLLAAVAESQSRLRKLIGDREQTLTLAKHLDGIGTWAKGRQSLIEQVEPVGEWEGRARELVLTELIAAREERALRSSAEVYALEAAVEWEWATLRELAGKLNLPTDTLPANEFELLDRVMLDDLAVRWQAKHNELAKQNATATGLFDQTLGFAAERLASIRKAQQNPKAELVAALAVPLLRVEVGADVAAWLAKKDQDQNRTAEIARREGQLLAAALARDRANLPAYVRLVALDTAVQPADLSAVVLRQRQFQILDRGRGFSPVPSTAKDVQELLTKRFTDPLLAVKYEAKLQLQWQDADLGLSFEGWMARHLTDAQLYELKVFLQAGRDRLRLISADVPQGFQEYVKVDAGQVDLEFAAVEAEVKLRAEGKAAVANLSDIRRAVLARHLGLAVESPADPKFYEAHWSRVRVYLSRTGQNVEAERVEAQLALPGYERHVAELEDQAAKLNEFEKSCQQYGKSADGVKEYRKAKEALAQSRGMVENGLKALAAKTSETAKVKQLQERVTAKLAAIPPPEKLDKIGLPYGDGNISSFGEVVTKQLPRLTALVDGFRSEAKKRAEIEAQWERQLAEQRAKAQFLKNLQRTYADARYTGEIEVARGDVRKLYYLGTEREVGTMNYQDEKGKSWRSLGEGRF